MQPTRQQIETYNKNFKLVEEVERTTTFSTKLTHDAFSEVDYLLDAPWEKKIFANQHRLVIRFLPNKMDTSRVLTQWMMFQNSF